MTTQNWYINRNHIWTNNDESNHGVIDGDIIGINGLFNGTNAQEVRVRANGTDENVNIVKQGDGDQLVNVRLRLNNSPWLRFDERTNNTNANGDRLYAVEFIGVEPVTESWSGVGETGNVVETESSLRQSDRMNW